MRGTVSKMIRRRVYGDDSLKVRDYQRVFAPEGKGATMVIADKKRAYYQTVKRKYKEMKGMGKHE